MNRTLEIVAPEHRQAAIEAAVDLLNALHTDEVWELVAVLSESYRSRSLDAPPTLYVHGGELEPMPHRAMVLQVGADGMGLYTP